MIFFVQTLGIFWGWTTLRQVLPWEIPDFLKPFIPFGAAYYLTQPDWLRAAAIAGLVGCLHTVMLWFIPEPTVSATQIPHQSRIPTLPKVRRP